MTKSPPYYRKFAPSEEHASKPEFRARRERPPIKPITGLTVLSPFVREGVLSPKLLDLDREIRRFMLKKLEKLSEEEAAEARRGLDLSFKYPSVTAFDDTITRCERASKTFECLAIATGDPLWIRLMEMWYAICVALETYLIEAAERAASSDEDSDTTSSLSKLESHIRHRLEVAGAEHSQAVAPHQEQIAH